MWRFFAANPKRPCERLGCLAVICSQGRCTISCGQKSLGLATACPWLGSQCGCVWMFQGSTKPPVARFPKVEGRLKRSMNPHADAARMRFLLLVVTALQDWSLGYSTMVLGVSP